MRLCSVVCPVLALGLLAACAGPKPAQRAELPVDDAALRARTRALQLLAEEALHPCAEAARPEDHGVFLVSARADGTVALGSFQWLGPAARLGCLLDGVARVRLPAWSGPSVSWLWSVGSRSAPAPGLLVPPPEARARLAALVGGAAPALAACGAGSARVVLRLFVFPDGRVAGVTPVGLAGVSAEQVDCLAEPLRRASFPAFATPGFLALDVTLPPG